MFRQSLWSRIRSALAPQRKLFLLVFLWTCLCLLIFKSILFNPASGDPNGGASGPISGPKLYARSAASMDDNWRTSSQRAPVETTDEMAQARPYVFEIEPELAAASADDSLAGRIVEPSSSSSSSSSSSTSDNSDDPAKPIINSVEHVIQAGSDSDTLLPFKYQLGGNSDHNNDNEDMLHQQRHVPTDKQYLLNNQDSIMLSGKEQQRARDEELKQQRAIPSLANHDHQPITEAHRSTSEQPNRTPPSNKSAKPLEKVTTDQQQQHQSITSGNKSHNNNNNNKSHTIYDAHSSHTNEQPVVGSACRYDYPNLFNLQFNNIYWQKLTTKLVHDDNKDDKKAAQQKSSSQTTNDRLNATSNTVVDPNKTTSTRQQKKPSVLSEEATFYLYNAYYDNRWRAGLPSVRVLAMIDRVQPPPTNCLLWSTKLRETTSSSSQQTEDANNNDDTINQSGRMIPLVTRAQFVYAWYSKWGNYKDGILQPWIITCPIPRAHIGLVPDSVSLVEVRREIRKDLDKDDDDGDIKSARSSRRQRDRRDVSPDPLPASIAMPPSFSSSSPAVASASSGSSQTTATAYTSNAAGLTRPMAALVEQYECEPSKPITNNLIVYNHRPANKQKFAVCVKGLDFPHEDVSVRLVEWIELLNLLGASKIFLYELDVHENISKVLNYYQKRGIVELTPLTLPGDQPNLPEYQHLYLKNKLTAKRQNELIPYNDCLYRNLNSYQYLALLDIDEIIMPLQHHHHDWYDLMGEVEKASLAEQNYSRASYNVRNVYFFDDLSGPLGTTSTSSSSSIDSGDSSANEDSAESSAASSSLSDSGHSNNGDDESSSSSMYSLERGIPHYLHMLSHVYRSKNYTEPGQYVKCFHNTERIVSLHNHFPMNCFGQCTTYSIPVSLAHLQHYRKDCVGPLKQSCKRDFRVFTTRDTTIWKYSQRMIRRTTRVLNTLGLMSKKNN